MGLVNCRECAKEVSDEAKTCPHCGIAKPAKAAKRKTSKAGKVALSIGAVFVLLALIGAADDDGEESPIVESLASDQDGEPDEVDAVANESPSTAPRARPDRDAPEAEIEVASTEEAACREDIQCYGDENILSAAFACEPYIEGMASYTMEWTDGWLEPKFGRFRWQDREAGVVTFIGDKARFQNGFGAWSNVRYECDFNPETEAVSDVRITD